MQHAACGIRCEHASCAATVDNQVNIREYPLMWTASFAGRAMRRMRNIPLAAEEAPANLVQNQ